MATEIQKQVLQLYVGILGRGVNGNADVDQEGFDYWVSQIEAGALSIADARRNFIEEQPEGQALYSGDTASVINGLYQNLFGRDAEAEGLAYWQEAVDNGTLDFAQVAEALVAGAQGSDVDTINARVDAQATVVGADETVDTAGLTAALNELSAAQEAEVDFREAAPALDSTKNVVNANSIDVDAGEASAQDIKDYYDDVAKSVGDASNVDVDGFEAKTASVQDAYIAAYETSLSADIDAASADLPSNITSLVEAVESRKEAYIEKIEATKAQLSNLDDEVAAFDNANTQALSAVDLSAFVKPADATSTDGEVLVMAESDYNPAADYSGDYVLVDGVVYIGELGTGSAEKALGDLTVAERSAQLVEAYQAAKAADSAESSAKTALEGAIEDVVLAENEAYELAGNVTGFYDDTARGDATTKAQVTIDLAQSVGVYETAADKTADVAEVQTLSIAADNTANSNEILTVTYGNDDSTGTGTVAVDLSSTTVTDASLVAAEVAKQLNADTTFSGLASAKASGTDVTITYDGTLEGTDVGTTVSATASINDSTTAIGSLDGTGSDVSAGGKGVTATVDAAGSEDLRDALNAQDAFAELVAQFQEARELNTELTALEEAIEEATAAITNEPDNVEAPGLGVDLATFDAAPAVGDDASAGNDVFLFEDDAGKSVEILDFGTSGQDRIYFGEGYNLLEISGDKGINGNEGDVAELEILWEEKGGDLFLYVEAETFAGNASSPADVTTIQLTGVTAEDITFEGGYLSAGEVA